MYPLLFMRMDETKWPFSLQVEPLRPEAVLGGMEYRRDTGTWLGVPQLEELVQQDGLTFIHLHKTGPSRRLVLKKPHGMPWDLAVGCQGSRQLFLIGSSKTALCPGCVQHLMSPCFLLPLCPWKCPSCGHLESPAVRGAGSGAPKPLLWCSAAPCPAAAHAVCAV